MTATINGTTVTYNLFSFFLKEGEIFVTGKSVISAREVDTEVLLITDPKEVTAIDGGATAYITQIELIRNLNKMTTSFVYQKATGTGGAVDYGNDTIFDGGQRVGEDSITDFGNRLN